MNNSRNFGKSNNEMESRNILFYSIHPNDKESAMILDELKRSPLLDKMFIKVCVNDKSIKLPSAIIQLGIVPVVAISGLNKLIMGKNIIIWLKNNCLSNNKDDLQYVDISSSSKQEYSAYGDEYRQSDFLGEANTFKNTNTGFGRTFEQDFDKGYMPIDNRNERYDRIESYSDDIGKMNSNESNVLLRQREDSYRRESNNMDGWNTPKLPEQKKKNPELDSRFEQMINMRNNELSGPKRIEGGLPNMNTDQLRSSRSEPFYPQQPQFPSSQNMTQTQQRFPNNTQRPMPKMPLFNTSTISKIPQSYQNMSMADRNMNNIINRPIPQTHQYIRPQPSVNK